MLSLSNQGRFLTASFYHPHEDLPLTLSGSENEVVARGVKAIGFMLHLTRRVPTLIQQSHLEESEGVYIQLLQ